jgi:preprotein translocase subunit SecF
MWRKIFLQIGTYLGMPILGLYILMLATIFIAGFTENYEFIKQVNYPFVCGFSIAAIISIYFVGCSMLDLSLKINKIIKLDKSIEEAEKEKEQALQVKKKYEDLIIKHFPDDL